MTCSSRHRLPEAWVQIIKDNVSLGPPNWADYNADRSYYEKLKYVSNDQNGILCRDDLPEQPDVDDYTDTDAAAETPQFRYSGMNRSL